MLFLFLLRCLVFALRSVLSAPMRMPLLTITPPLLNHLLSKPTNHRGRGDGTVGAGGQRGKWRESLSGKQESGQMSAPSGHFSSIHQLPWCTPKIEKPLFFSLQSPRQALLMCYRWIRHCAKDFLYVQANTHSSLFCQAGACVHKSFCFG